MGDLNQDTKMLSTISGLPIGTGILAFRDLPNILKKHINGTKALDFGCGAGRSSRILKHYGFEVTGVDISAEMIQEAKNKNDGICYLLTSPSGFSEIPQTQFDLILLSFVLMEIKSSNDILQILQNLKPLLREKGKIVVIAASDNLYKKNWLSIGTNYPTNQKAKSGDIVKVFLKDYKLEISDYLWHEKDCEIFFKESGLEITEKFAPLGKVEDNKTWIDEFKLAPFIIYVLSASKEDSSESTHKNNSFSHNMD